MSITVLTTLVVLAIAIGLLAAVIALTAQAVRTDSRGSREPPRSRPEDAPGVLPGRPYREIGV
jgi:hypothetical protein